MTTSRPLRGVPAHYPQSQSGVSRDLLMDQKTRVFSGVAQVGAIIALGARFHRRGTRYLSQNSVKSKSYGEQGKRDARFKRAEITTMTYQFPITVIQLRITEAESTH